MKKISALLALCLIGAMLFSCKDDTEDELTSNTWSLIPEGVTSGTYRAGAVTLSTQVYQIVESQGNPSGGMTGSKSTLALYFVTVGPPPTGTYSVTSVDKLSGKPDAVAIYLKTFDDPSTGLNLTSWYSQEDSGQTVSITFADGKISASFNNVVVKQSGAGPQTATLSADISQ